jgi:microsomal epoxide hydrolase
MADFATLPVAATIAASPFKITIPDEQIQEMRTLIKLSKPPPQTYEGAQKDGRFGVTFEWLANAKQKWLNEFDW